MKRSSPESSDLRDLQRWMRWIVTDPRGVRAALASPPSEENVPRERYLEPRPRCLNQVLARDPDERIERLDVYAEGYFLRLHETLGADFPVAAGWLGSEAFRQFAAEYLKHHPSRTPNAGEVGAHAAGFARVSGWNERHPGLAELLELELAVIDSFYSPAPEPAPDWRKHAGQASEDQWAFARLRVAPSARLLRSEHAVAAYWNADSEERDRMGLRSAERRENALVFAMNSAERGSGERVVARILTETEHLFLEAASRGAPLATIVEKIAGAAEAATEPAFDLTVALARWTAEGVVVGVEFPESTVREP